MKDIIRMNRLAGIITESQANKMMDILNEEESSLIFTSNNIESFKSLVRNISFTLSDDKKYIIIDISKNYPKSQKDIINLIPTIYYDYFTKGNNIYITQKIDEPEVSLNTLKSKSSSKKSMDPFKSISDINNYLKKGDYDELDGYSEEELYIINKHIKSDILDKGKELTPRNLNLLIVKLENK